MSITTIAEVESITVEKRTWHKDVDFQKFLGVLEAGTTLDLDGKPLKMNIELAEGILSYIDSKEAFVALVDEYVINEELHEGYDVYTVSRNELFIANRELLEDYVKPKWVTTGSDWVEFLYDSIAYYGIGEIGYADITNVFLDGDIEDENQEDAWHMGCYAINNIALHVLMTAYGVHTGKLVIVPPKPQVQVQAETQAVADKKTQTCAVTPHSFDSARLIFVSEVSNDGAGEILDTNVFIGDESKNEFMLNIKGADIEAFKQEFHELTKKYHA